MIYNHIKRKKIIKWWLSCIKIEYTNRIRKHLTLKATHCSVTLVRWTVDELCFFTSTKETTEHQTSNHFEWTSNAQKDWNGEAGYKSVSKFLKRKKSAQWNEESLIINHTSAKEGFLLSIWRKEALYLDQCNLLTLISQSDFLTLQV